MKAALLPLLLLAAGSLGGCAVYGPYPYYGRPYAYVAPPPVIVGGYYHPRYWR